MSQFFISCKESRIESNRSFYGAFYLGPFEPSQSITIANTLRRTLLSELYGLGIVSVEIDGATHEYSSLPGVRDSVLDILLNLKEIVLKKTIKNFKPQIGYLRARGPGVVRASNLRLPPFIQCIDPDQYIATLADNGVLNMKFIIQYGNKWLSSKNSLSGADNDKVSSKRVDELNLNKVDYNSNSNSAFNLHLKKRRLILKKLKHLSFNPVKNEQGSQNKSFHTFAQNTLFLSKYTKKRRISVLKLGFPVSQKYPAINLKKGLLKKLSNSIEKENFGQESKIKQKTKSYNWNSVSNSTFSALNKKMVFFNSSPLTIDAIFNPINKVNYIIEVNDFKTAPAKMQSSFETSELYEMLQSIKGNNDFLNTNLVEQDLKNYIQNQLQFEQQRTSLLNQFPNSIAQGELETILEIKREINALKKETIKHNITLEIWTNGSIHPRDALYQGFKNLIQLFSQLKKIKSFGVNEFSVSSLSQLENTKENSGGFAKDPIIKKTLSKKIKMGQINSTLLQELLPLNETSFLSTYVAPKLKNYYLNNQGLSVILNSPALQKNIENTVLKTNLSLKRNTFTKPSVASKADIGILNLSLRSYTSLKRLQINTIEELLNFSKNDLIQFKKLGQTSIEEIQKSLEKITIY